MRRVLAVAAVLLATVLVGGCTRDEARPSGIAERWLRAMRLHGEVGAAMQALGIGEAPLADTESLPADEGEQLGRAAAAVAAKRATEHAEARGAECASTADVLRAVIDLYGPLFDQALAVRGASRDELLDRLVSDSRL